MSEHITEDLVSRRSLLRGGACGRRGRRRRAYLQRLPRYRGHGR